MKYLIAGLGNIGQEYANTRHNIGFVVADALVEERKGTFENTRYADMAKVRYKGKNLVVIKPTTYMNRSGKAIRYWLNKENIPLSNLLVIVDDIDLPPGVLRLRKRGGPGNHNGMTDIVGILETTEFPRLRVGIGDDFARGHQVDYVLGKWSKKEEELMIPRIKQAVEMIESFVAIGPDRTMNIYN
ncbi:MAG: aminoacyl-tRNA hydrolase [Bacteroidales bacterium]|nr:aminoacyl-tRNA hydrolase [Bacteroidales bacterium]MCF8397471.1 aminoacyl-tRNA hydrolase [Bacteroidales bacterium]